MTINKNTVDSIGGCGIFLGVSNSLISENLISNCLLNISDFGSIFLFGLGGNTCHLQHNFILHTIGSLSATSYSTPLIAVGIYADVNSTGNTLEDNTIAYATNGILFSGGSSFNSLGRNVIYGVPDIMLLSKISI
jgi:parallel beta-helix repeat protein